MRPAVEMLDRATAPAWRRRLREMLGREMVVGWKRGFDRAVIRRVYRLRAAGRWIRRAEAVTITGAPPFMLPFALAANVFWRRRLVYRITDFYPECVIAALGREAAALRLVRRAFVLMRRRVDEIEVLGEDQHARLLVTADAHLITLKDAFVGYVLPSKVYACIESGQPILFVGSERSDVHRLCAERCTPGRYHRVAVGDVDGVAAALDRLAVSCATAEVVT